jgi:glutamine---fructose-6-phosphate transaminase (isomerizing)
VQAGRLHYTYLLCLAFHADARILVCIMCGIVGYVGPGDPVAVLVSGLHRLEYRGYDSAGIALAAEPGTALAVVKTAGKIAELQAKIDSALPAAAYSAGIGHTRWATHGAPTEANAHPHLSRDGRFAIVHNGIIENYAALRAQLSANGYTFTSETDSEVIAHLIEACDRGDLQEAVTAALARLEGAFGIVVLSRDYPGTLVAARKGSPIVVGLGNGWTVVASDVSAIVDHTKRVIFLNDGEIAWITPGSVDVTTLARAPVAREPEEIDWDVGRIEKGGHAHFMLKEIFEQPDALANAIRGRLIAQDGTSKLSGLQMRPAEIARMNRIVVAACGTSLYAGMVGRYFFEDIAGIPTDVEQAAEFRYRNPIIRPDTWVVAITQSGETADTLAAVREALRKGANVLAVCNVVGSTIAREAGRGVYLHAGPEIGVASTKAFTSQVAVLAMMALAFGRSRRLSADAGRRMVEDIARLPEIAAAALEQAEHVRKVAAELASARDVFFIGRGHMYPAALEGALKLKEISYIHAEGYHAAELKHGPIALLEENVPVVIPIPDVPGREKSIGNLQECAARGAPVIALAPDTVAAEIAPHCRAVIPLPECPAYLAPVPVVILEQLLAYYVALERGCPIDQPRNLAKSVTVE